jgi:hypothetical protein
MNQHKVLKTVADRYFPPILLKPEGSLKICVLNGSRQIEKVVEGQWLTIKVADEAGLPRGIYQLADAKDPSIGRESATFSSTVMHVSDRHVYQFTGNGKEVVRHARSLFIGEPKVGRAYDVSYENGQGIKVDIQGMERSANPAKQLESTLSR